MHKEETRPGISLFAAVFKVDGHRDVQRSNGACKKIGVRIGDVVGVIREVGLPRVFIEGLYPVIDFKQFFQAESGTQPF